MKLCCLIDSREYIATNCYQHQLSWALSEAFDVRYVTLAELASCAFDDDEVLLSRLKLRTLNRERVAVAEALNGKPLIVYDQDPWESFFPESECYCAYGKIRSTINVKTFLNTSHWWVDIVRKAGHPSEFVQMWLHKRYCIDPKPWDQRKHSVIFCGSVYPRRKQLFDALQIMGINVEIIPNAHSYPAYLDIISSSKIVIRSENVSWFSDLPGAGTLLTLSRPNALWIRDIECAGVGCFSMREDDQESSWWHINRMPSIVTFDKPSDAAEKVRKILTLSPSDAESITKQSSEYVKNSSGWSTVAEAIIKHSQAPGV